MAYGAVVATGNTDDFCLKSYFGKWVLIRYNNGLSSTFGHLSYILAKPEQIVNTGDIVGLSGNTGYSTGPHLHVSVYASQGVRLGTVPSTSCYNNDFSMPVAPTKAYLNPLLYLPKTIPIMFKKI